MRAFLAAGGAQLQHQLALSATRAGLALLPFGVGIVLAGALLVTPLRRRFGSVPVAVAGLAAGGTGLAWLAAAPGVPSYLRDLLPPLLLVGAALSLSSTGLKEHTLGIGPDAGRGVAAGPSRPPPTSAVRSRWPASPPCSRPPGRTPARTPPAPPSA